MEDPNRNVIERLLGAIDQGDLESARAVVHEDIVMEWPQSGERFRGVQNALGAVSAQEVKPEPAGEPRLVGSGDVWVVMMPLRYGEDVYHYVGVYELEGAKVRRSTEFFGAPFPPQESRAAFLDRG